MQDPRATSLELENRRRGLDGAAPKPKTMGIVVVAAPFDVTVTNARCQRVPNPSRWQRLWSEDLELKGHSCHLMDV